MERVSTEILLSDDERWRDDQEDYFVGLSRLIDRLTEAVAEFSAAFERESPHEIPYPYWEDVKKAVHNLDMEL